LSVTIIDYGLGNINAFANIYKYLNVEFIIGKSSEDINSAERLILPGVGSFDYAMKQLKNSDILDTLNFVVLKKKIPVLGVCVGMQIMANSSEEGTRPGLSWIEANVSKFSIPENGPRFPLPHMGWNDVEIKKSKLFKNINSPLFYFLHSYHFSNVDESDVIGITEYTESFVSAINKDNIYGVQFHPEKSHNAGLQLLRNFAEI